MKSDTDRIKQRYKSHLNDHAIFLNEKTIITLLINHIYTPVRDKRYIIETINDMLKNTAQIVHSRHRSVSNFIMNLISALGAYCFFDNKPKALQGYSIEDTKQLSLF